MKLITAVLLCSISTSTLATGLSEWNKCALREAAYLASWYMQQTVIYTPEQFKRAFYKEALEACGPIDE